MPIGVFLSTVTDEFLLYREQLRGDLTRQNVAVKVQEDFKGLGHDTLTKLDTYIAHCDAVVHLVGEMTGSAPSDAEVRAWHDAHSDAVTKLPPLADALRDGTAISYTQWEAWLGLYHGKRLLTAKAEPLAPRGPRYEPTDASRAAQAAHLGRLAAMKRFPDCTFANVDVLAKHIVLTSILELLATEFGIQEATKRSVAEGFIAEMAARVSADPNLDLEGAKQAIRIAIGIYEEEIAGGRPQTNLGEIVDRALANAKRLTDEGKSKLARAALRKAVADLMHDDTDRRAALEARIGALYRNERDIALASYDADAAADAILAMANALHPDRREARRDALIAEGDALAEFGDKRGSNVHSISAIAIRRATLLLAVGPDEAGADRARLGVALQTLGARESGTARLEEAVSVYCLALEECTRDRVPLDWAAIQNNLGSVHRQLGERKSDTARLEGAVAAYRLALEEWTRDRVPLDWAMTQNNLGIALQTLGEREGGTTRLEEAVAAYRLALEERTRDRVPLGWATTQDNLANALAFLAERTRDRARMAEAISGMRDAAEVYRQGGVSNRLPIVEERIVEMEAALARMGA